MLDVSAAREIVLRFAAPRPSIATTIGPDALGRVVAEDVPSDIDSPPFAKALMDGFAVRAADLAGGPVALKIVGEVPAGETPTVAVGPGEAVGIFTGAPMPAGADAVVMKERCEVGAGGTVTANDPKLVPGKNALPRAAEMRSGEVVVPVGTPITPAAVGLLAGVGRTVVRAYPRPCVGVLATGNELIEPNEKPSGGRIRNTNGPMLAALAARAGAVPQLLGTARDEEPSLIASIREGLANTDVLVLAGGVSAGKFDLVPAVLKALGVEIHFHHVRMKPGKPLLFGTKGETLVFGLPGNPVSAFVGFELFVRPALRKVAGFATLGGEPQPRESSAPLAANHDRPTYHPARMNGARVTPLPWFGSADLRGLLNVDGLIVLPPGEVSWPAGKMVDVVFVG